ncbi:MFS transporter [Rhodobacter veldkampii DSM 11550]|uniref:MFS transporter n=1 Tax=Phaeovulum veldkampii DSM 11550 TaxID=1185920 RepID=A0A2T4JKY1_9RHOB|nr:MFS transporter [Phaeovulum veldkampii]MBK5947435.1 MFS transporter [Phaeovulum veldkampii DSM 11550]PTE18523.1 MFS transporter [Phaeovulum veldkampii DSM 11550]TDQ59196.1 putative MFS family arabinose efflux permease [Phaeovulum veldkampii DSM 11550]
MLTVLKNSWPLLLGVMLLMVGNGMQGTLLGIRGEIEGIGTYQMSIVMSAYFAGFLLGSRLTPVMIQRVGHVRVFAALGSLISAVLILYAAAPNWPAWTVMRVLIGFSFSGVYITAESWLNASATNETRGQALSAYMIVQMIGIIAAQGLMNAADPSGWLLFVIPSVLVSLAFTPILLSAVPAPRFETTQRMSFAALFRASPLGCVGIFLMGGVFSALFGMASVWGSLAGLSVGEISAFVAAIYVGGLVFQYPIGWLSDRMDRRKLVLALAALGAISMAAAMVLPDSFAVLLVLALAVGGIANPIYSLLLAHTNDYLDAADMPAASAGLLFINGLGAIGGPLLTGWLMEAVGDRGFFLYIAILMALLALYAAWRMTRRAGLPADQTGAFAVVSPSATPVAVEAALEAAQEAGQDQVVPPVSPLNPSQE